MKKTFKMLAIAAAMLAAAGTASAAIADGTYTGESMGRNGPVKVSVTTKAGKIAKVEVVSHEG